MRVLCGRTALLLSQRLAFVFPSHGPDLQNLVALTLSFSQLLWRGLCKTASHGEIRLLQSDQRVSCYWGALETLWSVSVSLPWISQASEMNGGRSICTTQYSTFERLYHKKRPYTELDRCLFKASACYSDWHRLSRSLCWCHSPHRPCESTWGSYSFILGSFAGKGNPCVLTTEHFNHLCFPE